MSVIILIVITLHGIKQNFVVMPRVSDWRYAKCHNAVILPSVSLVSVIMLYFNMLNVIFSEWFLLLSYVGLY
jgi:hypothetical protein